MLGFGALGEFALGEGETQSRWFFGNQWQASVKRAGLSAAVVATTVAGFVPPPARATPVFSSFSQPQPQQRVPPVEQPVALFESAPATVPFSGFMDFGVSRFARYGFADQQTSMLFEVEFIPPVQAGGTSRKLVSEAEAPRGKKKTGFEPVKKVATRPLIEPRKPAPPLPPFQAAPLPEIDERSPLDLVDRAIAAKDLLDLQEQIRAAQAGYLDELDARDISDVLAILDDLDEEEA